MYRDLLAAIRSFEAGDRRPMLRLVAETTLVPEASPVRSFSEALYLAVTCHDYPQMWDPAAPLATRRQQLAAFRAARAGRALRPVHAVRVDLAAVRGRDRLPALARPAPARAAGRPAGAVPRGADAGRQQRPGQHHRDVGRARRRRALPELDLRRDPQPGPRLRARRPRPLRGADRPPLRPRPRRRRHELRRADAGGPRRRPLPAPRPRRRFPPTRRPATAARRPRGGSPPSPRPRSPTRSSAGSSTTAAPTAGCAAGAGAGAATSSPASASAAPASSHDVAVDGTATWRLGTGAVRADLTIPGHGRLRARWNVHRPLAVARLSGRLGGRRLRATMLAP